MHLGANLRALPCWEVAKRQFGWPNPPTGYFFSFWAFSERDLQYNVHLPEEDLLACTSPLGVLLLLGISPKSKENMLAEPDR